MASRPSLSPLQRATLHASILNVISTILAQLLKAYRAQSFPSSKSVTNLLGVEILPIFQFLFCALATTPLNFVWQEFLERKLPGYPANPEKQKIKVDDEGKGVTIEQRLDVGNTILKLLADQVVGGSVNTVLFLFLITGVKGGSFFECIEAVRLGFWPLLFTGYKVWPLVALLNFLVVPVDRRVVVASFVGVFWGIYMVLRVG